MRPIFTTPKAYLKSVVLGGGQTLFPIENPEEVAETVARYAERVAKSAYRQGKEDALTAVRKALGFHDTP